MSLKYLRNQEIRCEIAGVVGINVDKFDDRHKVFSVEEVKQICEYIEVGSTKDSVTYNQMIDVLEELLDIECTCHRANVGIRRKNLKVIHQHVC